MTTAPKGFLLNGFYDINLKAKPGPGIAEAEQGPDSRQTSGKRRGEYGCVCFSSNMPCSGECVAGGVCFSVQALVWSWAVCVGPGFAAHPSGWVGGRPQHGVCEYNERKART